MLHFSLLLCSFYHSLSLFYILKFVRSSNNWFSGNCHCFYFIFLYFPRVLSPLLLCVIFSFSPLIQFINSCIYISLAFIYFFFSFLLLYRFLLCFLYLLLFFTLSLVFILFLFIVVSCLSCSPSPHLFLHFLHFASHCYSAFSFSRVLLFVSRRRHEGTENVKRKKTIEKRVCIFTRLGSLVM